MPEIGQNISHYRIVEKIGEGGMGEVYLGDDTTLDRKVALKFLPEAFTSDPERMARFEREAKLLASLNHPNIAGIYGLEQADGSRFLVLEYVEGETLQARLSKGALQLEDALELCRQIAEGLEAAHEKGVIHRDLKPANVMITAEEKVKILDFGLAKALLDETQSIDSSQSPTLTEAMTRPGVILGTAAYMSPEQAKGKSVDKRADIWAFGCILYECLAGKKAFGGETVTETLAAVLKGEPEWVQLPTTTPQNIRFVLRRCLEKERSKRFRDVADVQIEIEEVRDISSVTSQVKQRHRWVAWSVAAIFFVAFTVASILGTRAYFQRTPEKSHTVRFPIYPPETWRLAYANYGVPDQPLAVSPDGLRIAFIASGEDGESYLWIRSLDNLTAQRLKGTDGAHSPFWSPDSRSLGFFTDKGKFKTIAVSGGPAITVCNAGGIGGTWNQDNVILFSRGGPGGLEKVSLSDGIPTSVTALAPGEIFHLWPVFLPDGRHFLYQAVSGQGGGPIYVASLDSAERRLVLKSTSSKALYSEGHLLFLRESTLMAQPFDLSGLVIAGDAFMIAEQVQTGINIHQFGVFSASDNGVLAYRTGAASGASQLVWFDRDGNPLRTLGDTGAYNPTLAPDGKRVSVAFADQGPENIWLMDAVSGKKTQFTIDATGAHSAIWSPPDGSRIVFGSFRKGHSDIYSKASNGVGGEEVLYWDDIEKYPYSWSPDGKFILYEAVGDSDTSFDLFVLPLFGDEKPFPFKNTSAMEGLGQYSPDGHWVAYFSNRTGRIEIYVAPFPPRPDEEWQISTDGGCYPRWRQDDGTEIFYLAPDNKLMVAAIRSKESSIEVVSVKTLFQTQASGSGFPYDVSADGSRFLVNTKVEQPLSSPITVVLNWTAGLKK